MLICFLLKYEVRVQYSCILILKETKMAKTEPFDNFLNEYEQWFIENNYVYESELQAIRQLLPIKGRGVEVGIGSGLFAKPLGIIEGCDPSANMLNQATERGLEVLNSRFYRNKYYFS